MVIGEAFVIAIPHPAELYLYPSRYGLLSFVAVCSTIILVTLLCFRLLCCHGSVFLFHNSSLCDSRFNSCFMKGIVRDVNMMKALMTMMMAIFILTLVRIVMIVTFLLSGFSCCSLEPCDFNGG